MYDWPVNGSGYPRTELPYLNWWSSEAGEVAERVLAQWERIGQPVIKKSARRLLSGAPIKIRWADGTLDDFDVVILAVGFGLESGVAADAGVSYWSNDALAQSYLGRKTPATVLVSGYGDGGLIDVIRATISKFNHQTFVKKYIHDTGLNEAFLAASVQGNTPGIDWTEVEFPNELKDKLAKDIRTDTDVIFNASSSWFFRRNASLFNRLIVALLLQMNAVTLRSGRLTRLKWWYRGRWRVLLSKPLDLLTVDHVVPRLGTEKECPKFFLSPVWNATQNKWTNERDNPTTDLTAHSHYPDHYLLDRYMGWRGELEYEIVFLCVSDAVATLLLQRIQALAPQPRALQEQHP